MQTRQVSVEMMSVPTEKPELMSVVTVMPVLGARATVFMESLFEVSPQVFILFLSL